MFLVAVKTAVVESLRAVWFIDQNVGQEAHNYNPSLEASDPKPRRVSLEYPEESEDWPALLVQVRPTVVEWTGISPDETVDAADASGTGVPAIDQTTTDDTANNPNPQYKSIRQGYFEASCMIQVLGLTSMERDRIWDDLVKLLLMGRKKDSTNNFYTTMETHDLVGLTVMEGSIRPVGDTVGMGTPWDPELLTYEAAVEFDMTGTFYASEFDEDLVPLKEAEAHEYIAWDGNDQTGADANEVPFGQGDANGDFLDPYE